MHFKTVVARGAVTGTLQAHAEPFEKFCAVAVWIE